MEVVVLGERFRFAFVTYLFIYSALMVVHLVQSFTVRIDGTWLDCKDSLKYQSNQTLLSVFAPVFTAMPCAG